MSSTKLEKLTSEQERLMMTVRDQWIATAFSGKRMDREAVKTGICWMYDLAKKPHPNFCWVESPYGAQLAANILSNGKVYSAVDSAVRSAVDSAVGSAVGSAVDSAVGSAVDSAVYSAVGSAVDSAVGSAVYSAVDSAVYSAVRSAKLQCHHFLGWTGTWNYGWAAFGDYFDRIGIIDNADFRRWVELLNAHAWDAILLDNGWAIVCECPNYVKKDEAGRLHNDLGPSCEWSDSWKLYFLDGIQLEESLWTQIVQKTLTAKEILALPNMEQRMIALKYAGAEHTLEAMGAKLVDKSERGNELYLVENFFELDPKAYFLKYSCPSTGRVYLSGIDPEFAPGKKADECMAWKHKITLPEYHALRAES